jgi:hypothetical protein
VRNDVSDPSGDGLMGIKQILEEHHVLSRKRLRARAPNLSIVEIGLELRALA